MTVTEIHKKVARFKPMARATLYNYLREMQIKPLGARQIPQRYPDDAADRVLLRLGFKQPNGRRARSRRQLQKEAA